MATSDIGFQLPSLPEELWIKVFSLLSLDDRKSIRSSCKRFYEIYYYWNLRRTKSMVFYGNLSIDAALQCFSSLEERKLWNIELNMVHLMDDSVLSFFKNQGTKVRSLILNNCTVVPGLLKGIIESCENLVEFSLSFFHYFDRPCVNTNEMAIIFSDFKALRESKIICRNVTNFTFKFDILNYDKNSHSIVTNKKLLDFFAVFPNITKLDLTLPVDRRFEQFTTDFSEITSVEKWTFSCIYYQLFEMRHQLESLSLTLKPYCFTYGLDLQNLNKISSLVMSNLKKRVLNIEIVAHTAAVPITQFQYLTHFKYIIDNRLVETMVASSVIQHVLNTAKQLCSLTIITKAEVNICGNCFQALVQSQLEDLSISSLYEMKIDVDYSFLENHILPNFCLKYLCLNTYNYNILLLFTTYFHCLEKLRVAAFNENILENIFKYQIKLRELELSNKEYRRDESSCPEISSDSLYYWLEDNQINRRLDYLVYLKIVVEKSFDFSEFLLSEFVFPKLKSLVIILLNSSSPNSNTDPLCRTIQKLTDLECLLIDGEIEIPFSQLLTLSRTLLRLRYIIIFNKLPLKLFENSEYHQLFKVNPLLRVVFHRNHSSSNAVKYFKDIMSNTVRNIQWPYDTIVFDDYYEKLVPYYKFAYEGIPSKYTTYIPYTRR